MLGFGPGWLLEARRSVKMISSLPPLQVAPQLRAGLTWPNRRKPVDLSRLRRVICAILFSRIAVVHDRYSDRSAVTGFTTAALRDGK